SVAPEKCAEDEPITMNLQRAKWPRCVQGEPRSSTDAIASCLNDHFSRSAHGPNDSAHRRRPLGDFRITRRRCGAAIRWSAWLGRLMAARLGADPALKKSTQRIRLLAQFRTLDVPN